MDTLRPSTDPFFESQDRKPDPNCWVCWDTGYYADSGEDADGRVWAYYGPCPRCKTTTNEEGENING